MFKEDKIKKIKARQILDSRGEPTLEVSVLTKKGFWGTVGVPAGASVGKKEAFELRDGGTEFFGKGVLGAVENVNTVIADALAGFNVADQSGIDQILIELDGTPNKRGLGGNTLVGVSLACARAAAKSQGLEFYIYLNRICGFKNRAKMPKVMFNLINGGLHADSGLDIQEFLFIPETQSLFEAVKMAAETYHHLGDLIKEKGLEINVGDEGGYAPHLSGNREAFKLIIEAAAKQNYLPGQNFTLGFDAAANSFLVPDSQYNYRLKAEKTTLNSSELIELYQDWVDEFHISTIEDGLTEEDLEGWKNLTKKLAHRVHVTGEEVEIVGDDLFVTQAHRLIEGIKHKTASAIIIKPNQVGTLSETFETVKQAKKHGFACIASHRSGETTDAFIADLAVGLGCDYIKAGAPARGERVAKYNRLLKIEEEMS